MIERFPSQLCQVPYIPLGHNTTANKYRNRFSSITAALMDVYSSLCKDPLIRVASDNTEGLVLCNCYLTVF